MTTWAEEELRTVHLGDARLDHRLMHIVEKLVEHPADSIPGVFRDWGEVKAVYRFWDSERVTPEAIRRAHQDATVNRMRGLREVLAIQDTTSLDFTEHPSVRGMGYLERPFRQGLRVHSTLTATTDGVPLGLIDQFVWARDNTMLGMSQGHKDEPTAQKESARWLNAYQATSSRLPAETSVLTLADAEADMFALLALPRRPGDHWLIRSVQDRRLVGQDLRLRAFLRSQPVEEVYALWLRGHGERPARCAHVALHYAEVTVQPPIHGSPGDPRHPVTLNAVLAEEEYPSESAEPVSWLLLTTRPVSTVEEARELVRLYSLRWLVERYHYVLKSGCHIEELQLERAERIQRALATYAVVAWRLLWLTYEARRHPDESCQGAMEPYE